ncbi:MAG: SDR family oxidoreductase [Marinifilaceae bacterium]|jgi:NAD(P)H dehydrogenase (quinone)|nr:SDR family oxidoreductase [Marinifilaceae bacterium]
MKIAVTGATGQLGQIVIAELKKRIAAESIIALARTPENASDLGVEVRAFDYNQEEKLSDSLNGIDKLILISGTEFGKRASQHINVINAAKGVGVKSIIYTSLLRADSSALNLAPEHVETENALKASGLNYTILRNGWYSENYTASIPGAIGGGAFLGSAGQGKISSAARADYAEAAAIVALSDEYDSKILELAGDQAYTLSDLAQEIANQTGNPLPYNNLPEEEYANILKNIGLPEGLALGLAHWDVCAADGDLFDNNQLLSKLLGRPTTPISESVKQVLA